MLKTNIRICVNIITYKIPELAVTKFVVKQRTIGDTREGVCVNNLEYKIDDWYYYPGDYGEQLKIS